MRQIEFSLKNLDTNYYLTDEECGFFNSFSSLKEAEKACKKVSAKLHISVYVHVTIGNIVYSNGKKINQ